MNDDHIEKPVESTNNQTDNQGKRRVRIPGLRLPRKRLVLAVAAVLVTAGLLAAAYQFFGSDIGLKKSDTIVIGDTTITKEDIDRYESQLNESIRGSSATALRDEDGEVIDNRKQALDALVLNAAFKLEAKQLGESLSEEEIRRTVQDKAGSVRNYDAMMSKYVSRINIENEAYKTKFADKLLAKKELLQAYIILDSPYFNQASNKDIQKYYDQARARMDGEIVPLMKSGKSKEDIAKKVDVILYDENRTDNSNWEQYFTKPVLVLNIIPAYLPEQKAQFNDIQDSAWVRGNLGKVWRTDEKLATLNNPGDYTGGFASKAGMYMAVRLESKTAGKYGSWDGLLEAYKKEYVTGKTTIASSLNRVVSEISGVVGNRLIAIADSAILRLTSVGTAKAEAQVPGGCSAHRVKFIVTAVDVQTGREINGAKIRYSRAQSGPACQQFEGTKTVTSHGEFTDNCFGPEPTWAGPIEHPPNYNYLGVRHEVDGNWRSGFPAWDPGSINGNSNGIRVQLRYDPEGQTGAFNLIPKSYVAANTGINVETMSVEPGGQIGVQPGDRVYFVHSIANTGGQDANNFDRFRQILTYDRAGNLVGNTTDDVWNSTDLPAGDTMYRVGDRYSPMTGAAGRAFNIPANAPLGTKYCQRIRVYPRSTDNNSERYSAMACAEVSYWELVPNSAISSDHVEQGRSVNFAHSLTNIGNQWSLWWTGNMNDYIRAWPQFNYSYANPADPNGSWYQGPEANSWDSNFIADSETRPYGEAESGGGAPYVVGRTLTAPDSATLGRDYCQNYKVYPYSLLSMAERTSAAVCARVVGGKTSVTAGATPGMVEPGEAATMTVDLNTNSFTSYGSWTGYNANCSYTVTTTVYGGGSSSAGGSCTRFIGSNSPITVANNPNTNLPIGSRICITATLSSAAGPSGVPNNNLLAAGGPTTTPPACVDIIAKPYLRAYGGDVAVGQGFGGAACNTNSSIITWNRGSGASYGGAGVQFAAFAQNQIRYFAAGQGLPAGDSQYGYAPSRLGFSNVNTNEPLGHFGGDFSGLGCGIPDYFGSKPPTTTNWSSLSGANGVGNGIFSRNGNLRLEGIAEDSSNIIENGSNIKLFVDGDVYITSNIEAAGGATTSIDVPGFTLIANGNIYISPSVTKLYGTYVAQPNGGSGGNIYTCASAAGTNFTALNPMVSGNPNGDYATCRTRLVVTGSFVAKKVNLLRTFGTRILDNGNGTVPNGAVPAGAGYANAAEIFHYNPLIWLRQSTSSSTSSDTTYDSITTLPPVL